MSSCHPRRLPAVLALVFVIIGTANAFSSAAHGDVNPKPVDFSYLNEFTCTDTDCMNCTVVRPNPNATINGNCVSLGGQSDSLWIYNNGTLVYRIFSNADCSGSPSYTVGYPTDKCIPVGTQSMMIHYNPPTPAPAPQPAFVKDIQSFVCPGTKCNNCTLEKLSAQVTVRANCAMWKSEGYSTAYYRIHNGTTLLIRSFSNNAMCSGEPSGSSEYPLDKCVVDGTTGQKSQIVFYTGPPTSAAAATAAAVVDAPFVTTDQFSFSKKTDAKKMN